MLVGHMSAIQIRAGFSAQCRAVCFVAAFFMIGEYLHLPTSVADTVDLDIADGLAIRGIITLQLQAFKNGHAARAFSYASPGIQEKFGNPERFVAMVKHNYPVVYSPREFEFLDLVNVNGIWVQKIMLVDTGGDIYIGHYPMERQTDGKWLIDGCFLTLGKDKNI